ncbi:SusC/RagA family TonB-linked outer membrane protein [Pedobacter steynii]|uniref:SusC/RagA family TonB-linked outer membrane protein n=1 Tax=Pedobacter steynii TaxID=430522 RepID=UPI0009F2DE97|nr:SusC/RagA family TonB-linked outer membrane protein [Pedobacter steynii]
MIRKLHLCLILVIPLLVCSEQAFTKERFSKPYHKRIKEIRGRVTASDDQLSIPGVSVVLKSDPKTGTKTDENGNFILRIPDGPQILIFTYVGYKRKEVPVNNESTIEVVLSVAEENTLNQVVVTAMGVKKDRKALAYALTEVKGTEFTQARETNLANALVGKVAGVNATSTATGPSGSSRVIIRGNGSLNGNNQPLYVVNDMPIDNTLLGLPQTEGYTSDGIANGLNIDRGDGISGINPDDIQSITVLKGGTAAALYGSLASNGVILIKTKRGAMQKGLGIDFNSAFTMESPLVSPEWQYEYGSGKNGVKPLTQADAIAAGRSSWGAKMDGSDVIQFDGVKRPYSPQKDNIQNFYQTGTTATNTLALTGGNESANGRFSISDMNNRGIVPNTKFNRKTFNFAGELILSKWLRIDAVMQYNLENAKNRTVVNDAYGNPNWGTYLIGNTIDIRNLSPGYDANGDEVAWNPVPIASNPYFVINKFEKNDTRNRFLSMVNLKLNVLPELFFNARIGQDYNNFKYFGVVPSRSLYTPLGGAKEERSNLTTINTEATINYNKQNLLKDFSLNALFGFNNRSSTRDEVIIQGKDFITPDFYSISNLGTVNQTYPYGKTKTSSLFGSADFDYKNLIFLTVTGRQDWFSTLAPKNNTIFYPSVGMSAILSQMVKMPSWIQYAKLRSSWAQVGGATPEPYALNPSYTMIQNGHLGQQLQQVTSTRIPNPNLSPLTSTTFEAGFEASLFQNRLGIDFAWYDRSTTKDIVETTVSTGSGYRTALLNVGEISNKGVELLITGKILDQSDFSWSTSVNTAYNKNKVLKLAENLNSIVMAGAVNGYAYIYSQVGSPYSIIMGRRALQDANGKTVYNVSGGVATPVPGPLEELGQGVHPWSVGFSNDFKYKRFNLNVLIDGKFGGSLYSGTDLYGTRMGLTKMTLEGRDTGVPINGVDLSGKPVDMVIDPSLLEKYYGDGFRNISSLFVYDASFIKLRQVVLSYQLPVSKVKMLSKLSSATLSLVGRNLFILYKKTPNVDPESVFSAGNAQGIEQFGVPRTRSYGLNLSVKF